MAAVADKASLTRALKAEYMDALAGRLTDPERLNAVWHATFQAQSFQVKLDAVVNSAAYLLGCPYGSLNVLTEQGEQVCLAGDSKLLPVRESFCQHVSDGKPFGVDDALEDLLVCDMAVVTIDGLRAYLGVPIIFWRQVVGSLCVWDLKPHEWTATDVRALTSLALTIQEILQ